MSHRANDEMDARLLTGVSENSTYDPLREGLPGWPPGPDRRRPDGNRARRVHRLRLRKFGRKGQEIALRFTGRPPGEHHARSAGGARCADAQRTRLCSLEPCFPAFWQFAPAKPFRGAWLVRAVVVQAGHRGRVRDCPQPSPADSPGVANQHRPSARNILDYRLICQFGSAIWVLNRRRWDSREQQRIATVTWIERPHHRR